MPTKIMKALSALEAKHDIDGLAGEEEELAKLVERLDNASTAYGMEISAEKTKLMTNNTTGINTEIKVNLPSSPPPPHTQLAPSPFHDTTDALPGHIHLPVCL